MHFILFQLNNYTSRIDKYFKSCKLDEWHKIQVLMIPKIRFSLRTSYPTRNIIESEIERMSTVLERRFSITEKSIFRHSNYSRCVRCASFTDQILVVTQGHLPSGVYFRANIEFHQHHNFTNITITSFDWILNETSLLCSLVLLLGL